MEINDWLNKYRMSKCKIKTLATILFVLSLYLLIKNKGALLEIFQINSFTIKIIIALILLLVSLYLYFFKNFFKNHGVRIGDLLTATGILFAILFFILDDYASKKSKIDEIRAADIYNCEISTSMNEVLTPTKFTAGRFLTNTYENHLGLIFSQFGQEKYKQYAQNMYDMNYVNTLLEIHTRGNVIEMEQQRLTEDIISRSNIIKGKICS